MTYLRETKLQIKTLLKTLSSLFACKFYRSLFWHDNYKKEGKSITRIKGKTSWKEYFVMFVFVRQNNSSSGEIAFWIHDFEDLISFPSCTDKGIPASDVKLVRHHQRRYCWTTEKSEFDIRVLLRNLSNVHKTWYWYWMVSLWILISFIVDDLLFPLIRNV